jgi:hypothetical protein
MDKVGGGLCVCVCVCVCGWMDGWWTLDDRCPRSLSCSSPFKLVSQRTPCPNEERERAALRWAPSWAFSLMLATIREVLLGMTGWGRYFPSTASPSHPLPLSLSLSLSQQDMRCCSHEFGVQWGRGRTPIAAHGQGRPSWWAEKIDAWVSTGVSDILAGSSSGHASGQPPPKREGGGGNMAARRPPKRRKGTFFHPVVAGPEASNRCRSSSSNSNSSRSNSSSPLGGTGRDGVLVHHLLGERVDLPHSEGPST